MKKIILSIVSIIMALCMTSSVFGADIPLTAEGELSMEDYSVIELKAEDVLLTDETVSAQLELMRSDLRESEEAELPELTDAFVSENSLYYFGTQLDSVQAAKDYIKSTLEESNKKSALIEALRAKAQVLSYPETDYNTAKDYFANEIAYYAVQAETDEDSVAVLNGYGSADEYIIEQTEEAVTTAMIIDYILDEKDIVCSDEDRDQALGEYMAALGYDSYASVDEFKETAGDTWLWLFTQFQYKSNLMYEVLQDQIRMVE